MKYVGLGPNGKIDLIQFQNVKFADLIKVGRMLATF